MAILSNKGERQVESGINAAICPFNYYAIDLLEGVLMVQPSQEKIDKVEAFLRKAYQHLHTAQVTPYAHHRPKEAHRKGRAV